MLLNKNPYQDRAQMLVTGYGMLDAPD